MSKTKTQTSSKNQQTRNITLADGTKIKTDNNHGANIKKGKISKHNVPAKPFSKETGKGDEDWEVNDDYNDLKYPPPSTHPFFRECWAKILPNISERSNFNESHLGLLEAYCRLRVELRALDDFIQRNGHTYRVTNVMGDRRVTYPEINERMKVLAHLARYSSLLDLLPKKDKSKSSPSKGEDDWG